MSESQHATDPKTDGAILDAMQAWLDQRGRNQVAVSADFWAPPARIMSVCGHRGGSIREAGIKMLAAMEGRAE